MFASDMASSAAASSAPKMSWPRNGLDLDRAECKIGYASFCEDTVLAPSVFCTPPPDRFGDEDMVVTVVVAVGGRSSETLDTAAADVAGSLPVSSNRWIRDFKSSSSSHTVEGAFVEAVDSVPSTPCAFSACCWPLRSKDRTSGDELYDLPYVYPEPPDL